MEDFIPTFKIAVHRAKDEDILDESEFVNNFMWEHSLHGKDIYDELLHEVQQIKSNMVKFVSYDGKYPCLCMGTLTIKVDGKTYRFNQAMISGGCVLRNEDWDMWAEQGDWKIDLEEHPELEPYKEEITCVVNDNVKHGCCGGCI